ncbi:MAG: hypothetical protein ACK56F_18585 [bacterium]
MVSRRDGSSCSRCFARARGIILMRCLMKLTLQRGSSLDLSVLAHWATRWNAGCFQEFKGRPHRFRRHGSSPRLP